MDSLTQSVTANNPAPTPAKLPVPAWHRRLEAQVVAGVTVVVALSLGAVLIATTRTVRARSLERAATDLQAARSLFDQLATDRTEFAAAQAALVTALPIFRSHMTDTRLAGDMATIESMADEYRHQLKADFSVVTDHDGRWIGRAGAPARLDPPPASIRAAVEKANSGQSVRDIAVVNGQFFLLVSQPARFAEEILGTLTIGYALDNAVARRLAEATRCEVNLLDDGGHLSASSLSDAGRQALTAVLAGQNHLSENGVAPAVRRVGDSEYAIGIFPLAFDRQSSTTGRLVLLQNWRPTEAFVGEVQHGLVAAGSVIFCIAVGVGLLFSRRTSRPIQDLADTAGDIAGGNWARQAPVRGGAEVRVMAQAFNDMTASLRHWYEQVKRRDDQLRQSQKMEAIGRLAGGVAHDFNNLLTAIKGYGELLRDEPSLDDASRHDANEILKAADRAVGLTRQLLAFSRGHTVAPRVLALNQIVAGTEQMLRRLIREDITLMTAIGSSIASVRADAGQIEQVLVNLVVNARDAMPDGGTLRIELANVVLDEGLTTCAPPLSPGAFVRLSIVDTGHGMNAETVSRIFEPFFTTKGEGSGTGLGLATVYAIVDKAGGAIDVDTAVGRGTTFHVYLPQVPGDADEADGPEPAPRPAALPGSETVLLVEDDRGVGELIGSGLRKAGYTVLEAFHGAQALEIVRGHHAPIHLLLTDVVMPGMNGRELSEHVVALRPQTRVLFMSGYYDDAILRHGIETASAQFIQKPFSVDELAVRIRKALQPRA